MKSLPKLHTFSAEYRATLFTQWVDNKEAGLNDWIKNIPHIKVSNESDFKAFITLSNSMKFNNLTSLCTMGISHDQLQALSKRVPHLEKLDIRGRAFITQIPAGLTKLIKGSLFSEPIFRFI